MLLAEVFHEKASKNEVLKLANLSSTEVKVRRGLSSSFFVVIARQRKDWSVENSAGKHVQLHMIAQVVIGALHHYPVLRRLEISRSSFGDVESVFLSLLEVGQ